MYDYLLSVFLGIVEGLTEFLPVSSTAHLRICEALLHIDLHDGFWKMYTIVIQLGAILALPVYFWGRIMRFVRTFPKGERGNRTILTHPLSLTLIAFMVVAVGYDFLKSVIPHHHEAEIAPLTITPHQWVVIAIGFVVSFFVALAVVAWFMNWVRARGFVPFAVYRIVLGLGLLTLLMRGMMSC